VETENVRRILKINLLAKIYFKTNVFLYCYHYFIDKRFLF